MALIKALLSDLWPYIAGLLALVGGAFGIYFKGRQDSAAKAKAKADKATIETIKRIEDAKETSHAGGAAWHDRLRGTDK